MKGVGQIERIGEMRNAYSFSGNLKQRDRFGYSDRGGRMVLKLILKK
jgi:hypothetical protein